MRAQDDIAARAEEVAKALFGDPNPRLSTKDELRFGSNGSLRVTIAGEHRGTWRDHESGEGGGVLDLIAHRHGGDRKSAAAWLSERDGGGSSREPVAVYRYENEQGELVHEVLRYEPKTFRQRRPDGSGGHLWNMKGVKPLLYRLPLVAEAVASDRVVFVVEGEKDADKLVSLGLIATCNAGGAGKWRAEHAAQLTGARVAIIPDNDEAGRDHADQVAASLRGIAEDVRMIELGVGDRKADVSDWLAQGGTTARLDELHNAAPQWRPQFKPRFPLVWFGSEDDHPPLRYLVKKLLVSSGLSVVFGAPKSTKTFLSLDLSLHVAHGRDWFGLHVKRSGVVYVCGEGAAGARQRMKAWRQEFEGQSGAPFVLLPQAINLFDDPDEVERLIADINALAEPMGEPVGLVVLDTLSRMIGSGDENQPRDINKVVAAADRIQRLTGAHVMIVHHSGKDRDRGMRGSNALLGAVDAAIEVTRDADTGLCEAKVTALKDGGEIGPFAYELRPTAVGEDEEGEEIFSCVLDPAGARQGKRAKLTAAETRALTALRAIIGDSGDMPGHCRSALLGTWRDKFHEGEKGELEAIKKRFQRAKNALEDKGLVRFEMDTVYLEEGEE